MKYYAALFVISDGLRRRIVERAPCQPGQKFAPTEKVERPFARNSLISKFVLRVPCLHCELDLREVLIGVSPLPQ